MSYAETVRKGDVTAKRCPGHAPKAGELLGASAERALQNWRLSHQKSRFYPSFIHRE
jgi:hypothetical protein